MGGDAVHCTANLNVHVSFLCIFSQRYRLQRRASSEALHWRVHYTACLARVHYIGMPRQRMVLRVDAGAAAFGGDALTADAFDAAGAKRPHVSGWACAF